MIKCKVCENLQQTGNKYICSCNASREVWGELQEEIFKPCTNFKPTNQHRKRQAWVKKMESLPIDDSGHGINIVWKPASKRR